MEVSGFFFEAIEDTTKLALIVACLNFALRVYTHHTKPTWSEPLERRRVVVLWLLALGATAIKIGEDVLGGESGPVDRAGLLFVRAHVPEALTGFFAAVTLSGSARVMIPLAAVTTIALLLAKRRYEATLLGASVLAAAATVYGIKVLVGRARPALWQTEWYWGPSFPSGHTLVVAAFATALALGASRIWPSTRRTALSIALVWILVVACSRLVLGVHWPTDVLAAICIGASIPLAIAIMLELRGV